MAGSILDVTLDYTVADPAGNGQPSAELIYTDPDTSSVVRSGHFIGVHGGGPLNFRIVQGNPSPSDTAGSVYELNDQGRINEVPT
jgi:hypothetical protein